MWGYVDGTGRAVVPFRFDSADSFSEGLAAARDDGLRYGYIDTRGEWVITPRFDSAGRFSEGIAAVYVQGGFGFIDHTGSLVIQPLFELALDFSEGLAAVLTKPVTGTEAGTWGYIDRTGQFAIPPQFPFYNYDHLNAAPGGFSEGLADIQVDYSHRRFIDKTGRFVLDAEYRGTSAFRDGLAAVVIADVWGYIDKTGRFVIPPQYRNAHAFEDGLASVMDAQGKDACIDKSGEYVWRAQ